MHVLEINKLGPIKHCKLEVNEFVALTGFQASGKSTIAKAVYYFRTVKDDIVELFHKNYLQQIDIEEETTLVYKNNPYQLLENHLREKFLRTFGSSWGMPRDMHMEYYYSEDCYIKVELRENKQYAAPNYVWITICTNIKKFLNNLALTVVSEQKFLEISMRVRKELDQLFNDQFNTIYIPAGRSMMTILSQQLSYLYLTMDDGQKRTLDTCTRDYVEHIFRIKSEFQDGLYGILNENPIHDQKLQRAIYKALSLIEKILKGNYRYVDGEERIVIDDGKYVKINFSSAGQQEAVWILNLLFYYLVRQKHIMFIIEEPESHLFPESQKYITELISLVHNFGQAVLVTTHSPYVLGTLNNLLYADSISKMNETKADKIIPKEFWINYDRFKGYFVKNGGMIDAMDYETKMIQNELIDEISVTINGDFDQLLNIQWEEEQ